MLKLLKPKSKAEITALEARAAKLRAEMDEVRTSESAAVEALEALRAREQAAREEATRLRREAGATIWAERLPTLHAPEQALAEWASRFDAAILATMVPLMQEGLALHRDLRRAWLELEQVRAEWELQTDPAPMSVPVGMDMGSYRPDGTGEVSGGLAALLAARVHRLRRDGRLPGGV
ncbi:hypothetical protein DYH09_35070 [bacterium CPR1]|nr:hypothetical protein [bacterium CPR1]